jgi:GntR family transcriptional regulator, carbon starvation induced regulator
MTTIRKRTLASDVFDQIRGDILECRLAPGTRLRFKDLRARYKSGLSPIREALMRLVADDLVILEDHKGFRVAPVSQEELVDLAMTWFELEALGIRQSIKKGDDRWEANIQARFRELSKHRMRSAQGRLDPGWEPRNLAFHESLYAACGSPSLMRFCRVLSERFSRYRRLWARRLTRTRDISKEHDDLCRAVLNRDTTAAVAALRKHRTTTIQDLLADWNEPDHRNSHRRPRE